MGDEQGGEDGASPPAPPPPTRGWYRVPGKPEYQHFWDGQKWSNQRYWGLGAGSDAGAAWLGAPPAGRRRPLPPGPDAPVQYRGFFDVPFNPRSPARYVSIALLLAVLLAVYLSLHVFSWRALFIPVVLGLLSIGLWLPANLRYLRDPARRAAIREPILFSARVWVRFTYVPNLMYSTFGIARWDLAVRTDSFQMTHWIWGSRNRARNTFFSASEAIMWQALVEGRDCIVVSGPTYNRAKMEFAFSTGDRNEQAWNALAAAGVTAVPPPTAAPASPAGLPPPPRQAADQTPPRRFRRLGADLGTGATSRRTAAPSQTQAVPSPTQGVPSPTEAVPLPSSGPYGRRRRPLRAGGQQVALVVVGVVFVLAFYAFTMVRTHVHGPLAPISTASASIGTTQCVASVAAGGPVDWSGTVAANSELETQGSVEVKVLVVSANQTVVGQAVQTFPVTRDTGNVTVGPMSIVVDPGSGHGPFQCQAAFVTPNGLG